MELLITGAGGLLGKAVHRRAVELGWRVEALDRERLDVTRSDAVRETLTRCRPRWVVNCAAFSQVDQAELRPQEAMAVNRLGAWNLACAAAEVGALLIHISTDYVFDGRKGTPYLPSDRPAPVNVYGISKLAGEIAVRESGCRSLIVRTSWLFGEGGQGFVALVERFVRAAAEDPRKGPLRAVADERSRPTWVEDLARGLLELAARGVEGTLHLANGGECSRFELALEVRRWVAQGAGGRLPLIFPVSSAEFGALARRPPYSVLDTGEAEGILGWQFRPWREALAAFLRGRGRGGG